MRKSVHSGRSSGDKNQQPWRGIGEGSGCGINLWANRYMRSEGMLGIKEKTSCIIQKEGMSV